MKKQTHNYAFGRSSLVIVSPERDEFGRLCGLFDHGAGVPDESFMSCAHNVHFGSRLGGEKHIFSISG